MLTTGALNDGMFDMWSRGASSASAHGRPSEHAPAMQREPAIVDRLLDEGEGEQVREGAVDGFLLAERTLLMEVLLLAVPASNTRALLTAERSTHYTR